MKVKVITSLLIMFIILLLTACSSNSNSEGAKMSEDNSSEMDNAQSVKEERQSFSGEVSENEQSNTASVEVPAQKVIYQAELHLRVKKFEQTFQNIEAKVIKYGGYIAESNVMKEGEEQVSGRITIRVPQKHFQTFLNDAEGQAAEVLQRNITGTDVTEEYVDLESRLKSKRVVEERLLAFMKSAAKTEDLLKISSDLAAVQEEIEMIQGRMKYLDNQTAFSTIHITLYEHKVIVPNLEDEDLNTWEKTKKQFMKSTNVLLAALSGLVVFLLGNLPILIILALIFAIVYFYITKVVKRKGNE